jgi:prepilin signal peptidase PulO-like enzyme (type II secretory pathway)
LGLAAVMAMVSAGRLKSGELSARPIPFGPFLALAALVYLFFGRGFMSWYFSFLTG